MLAPRAGVDCGTGGGAVIERKESKAESSNPPGPADDGAPESPHTAGTRSRVIGERKSERRLSRNYVPVSGH